MFLLAGTKTRPPGEPLVRTLSIHDRELFFFSRRLPQRSGNKHPRPLATKRKLSGSLPSSQNDGKGFGFKPKRRELPKKIIAGREGGFCALSHIGKEDEDVQKREKT
jgi:hypothetical protein